MDLEVIRRILIEAKTTGVEKATADLKGLSTGYEGVTVASQKTETATESVTRKFQAMESRLDPAARAARNLAKDISTLDQAFAQGGVSAQRHGELLEIANQNAIRMSGGAAKATGVMEGLRQATSGVSGQLIAMAAGAGPVGIFLSALGPWGIAAAVGLGAAGSAFGSFFQAAHDIAAKSDELKRFAETTGLTTDQVQNLGKEAKRFGLSGDDIKGGLQRFAAGFEELREGGGSLLQSIQRVDAGLAAQMQTDETAADALIHLQQALRATDNVFEQSRIARAALGRGGVGAIEFLKGADLSKLNNDVASIGYGLDKNLIQKTRELNREIEETDKKIQHAFGADFAPFFLKLELAWKQIELAAIKAVQAGVSKPVGQGLVTDELKQQQDALVETIKEYEAEAAKAGNLPWAQNLTVQLTQARAELERINAEMAKRTGSAGVPNVPILDLKGVQNAVYGSTTIGAGPGLGVQGVGTIEAATAAYKKQQDVLGGLVPVADQVANKMRELMIAEQNGITVTQEQTAALLAQKTMQAELAQSPSGSEERRLAALQQLMALYPGLTAQQALAAQALADQLALARAVTEAEKLKVQAAIDYRTASLGGATAQNATAEATKKVGIAQAAANAAVEQQIKSLQQASELIIASIDHTTELVKQRQAYNNALASNAGEAKARELVAAMRQQVAAQEELKAAQASWDAEQARALAACQAINAAEQQHLAILNQEIAAENAVYQGASLLSQMTFNAPSSGGSGDAEGVKRGGVAGPAVQGLLDEIAYDKAQGYTQAHIEGSGTQVWVVRGPLDPSFVSRQRQQAIEPFEIQRVQAQISGNKGAEINAVQGELGYLRSQPQTLENLNAIKSLMDALKQLTAATNDNTQSQNALSGLYSRQFGQGFYDGGAAVGELIYGLDNNTGSAIDAMQRAGNDNTRNQNDLLRNLSENQIGIYSSVGGGIVSATNSVQSELRTGFSNVTMALQQRSPTSPSPTTPSPTTPFPIAPIYPHIPGTPGFARGGSFTTAGYGGDDSNVVAFRVSPQRERVTITPVNGGGNAAGATVVHNYNDIAINVPQDTDEFRSSAMQVAEEIFNQVAVAGRRK